MVFGITVETVHLSKWGKRCIHNWNTPELRHRLLPLKEEQTENTLQIAIFFQKDIRLHLALCFLLFGLLFVLFLIDSSSSEIQYRKHLIVGIILKKSKT